MYYSYYASQCAILPLHCVGDNRHHAATALLPHLSSTRSRRPQPGTIGLVTRWNARHTPRTCRWKHVLVRHDGLPACLSLHPGGPQSAVDWFRTCALHHEKTESLNAQPCIESDSAFSCRALLASELPRTCRNCGGSCVALYRQVYRHGAQHVELGEALNAAVAAHDRHYPAPRGRTLYMLVRICAGAEKEHTQDAHRIYYELSFLCCRCSYVQDVDVWMFSSDWMVSLRFGCTSSHTSHIPSGRGGAARGG